jgi:hypothetical protein
MRCDVTAQARPPIGLGPLPKPVFNQLGGKRGITGIACNP